MVRGGGVVRGGGGGEGGGGLCWLGFGGGGGGGGGGKCLGGGGVVWCLGRDAGGGGGWWCTPLPPSHQPPQNVDLSYKHSIMSFTSTRLGKGHAILRNLHARPSFSPTLRRQVDDLFCGKYGGDGTLDGPRNPNILRQPIEMMVFVKASCTNS